MARNNKILLFKELCEKNRSSQIAPISLVQPARMLVDNVSRRTVYLPEAMAAINPARATQQFFYETLYAFHLIGTSKDCPDRAAYLTLGLICRVYPGLKDVVVSTCKTSGYDLERCTVRDVLDLADEEVPDYTRDDIDEHLGDVTLGVGAIECYVSVLMLLFGKRLTTSNYEQWVKARISGVCSKHALQLQTDFLIMHMPSVECCMMINDYFSAVFLIRAGIVKSMLDSRNPEDPTKISINWTSQMLAYSNSSHVQIIVEQVLLGHPEAFAFPELKAERKHFLAGIDALRSLKENELPYYQFLIPPNVKQPFLSKNLCNLTRLAWEIAVKEGKASESQKNNYLGTESAPGTIVTNAMVKLGLALETHTVEEVEVVEDIFGDNAGKLLDKMEKLEFDYLHAHPPPRRNAN